LNGAAHKCEKGIFDIERQGATWKEGLLATEEKCGEALVEEEGGPKIFFAFGGNFFTTH